MKLPTRQCKRLIWLECDPQEIVQLKAKYSGYKGDIDEIPLDTEPGKYFFNNKEYVYVLDTEYRYTGTKQKREVWITFLLESDPIRKYSGFTNWIRKITDSKRGSHSKLNK